MLFGGKTVVVKQRGKKDGNGDGAGLKESLFGPERFDADNCAAS